MEWLPSNPDLNPVEKLWSVVKIKLYERGKQYNNKADPWKAIKTTMLETQAKLIVPNLANFFSNQIYIIKGHMICLIT